MLRNAVWYHGEHHRVHNCSISGDAGQLCNCHYCTAGCRQWPFIDIASHDDSSIMRQHVVDVCVLYLGCTPSVCKCPCPSTIVLMAAVQKTSQELVYLLQVPLPWENRHCVSLCQLLNRSSRLHCQLHGLMQQVLKCFWLHSYGA